MESVVEDEIHDICAIGDHIYAISDNGLILLNTGETIIHSADTLGKERFGTLRYSRLIFPTSLCQHMSNLLICEAAGRIVRRVDLESKWTKHENKSMPLDEFRKTPPASPTGITALNNDIFWSVAQKDACYACNFGNAVRFAGTGRRGYSCSQSALLSQIAYPCGVAANGKVVYIADTMNQCIRYVQSGRIFFFCGAPKEEIFVNPKKIIHLRQQLLVIDSNELKSITIIDGVARAIPIYNSKKVVSACWSDKRILILEENGKETSTTRI